MRQRSRAISTPESGTVDTETFRVAQSSIWVIAWSSRSIGGHDPSGSSERAIRVSSPIPIHVVDAFTDVAFRGNPAAVCLIDGPREDAWLQAVAAEMNLAETAFVWREGDALRIRWFTPTVEVPLCGHATLASAHVLYELGRVSADASMVFEAPSGRLSAAREGEWIRLDFPALPPRAQPRTPPDGLIRALGLETVRAPRAPRVYEVPRPGATDGPSWLVELESAAALRAVVPRFRELLEIEGHAVILTAPGEAGADFVSRFFAPRVGIDEDPVTGSAHCTLAPFWCARLGRDELTGRQLSQRTGTLRVRHHGDRVELLGRAVTVLGGAGSEGRSCRRRIAEPAGVPRPLA